MIKLVYCITRKEGMSKQEFLHYWRHVHAPIGAEIPGIRRFVQSSAIQIMGEPHEPDYDGVVELWFDNEEALLNARRSPQWAASTADEANFIDPSRVAYLVTVEDEIVI
jgi:uncharacterized protein (TIGR02118 family)